MKPLDKQQMCSNEGEMPIHSSDLLHYDQLDRCFATFYSQTLKYFIIF